jgi:transposase InsO family protein
MDDNYKTPLIEKAIKMAARNHELADDAIFHSDRGSNYTSSRFAKTLKKHKVRQSVGRTGICFDNALAESFFAALRTRGFTVPNIPPASTPAVTLPDTSSSDTILDVATQDSSIGPRNKSTTST